MENYVELNFATLTSFSRIPREVDVLELIIKGNDRKKIAAILKIDKSTVDYHRKNMLRKTNSQNMVQVVIAASKSGVINI
jgi:NarL family two-component system response regulator LiaR